MRCYLVDAMFRGCAQLKLVSWGWLNGWTKAQTYSKSELQFEKIRASGLRV